MRTLQETQLVNISGDIAGGKKTFTVVAATPETPGVVTLELVCEDGALEHTPGQFITVYLPELGTPEGKAYSISSAPHEPLSITISSRGEFSKKLCSMRTGDTLLASGPEGYFFSESPSSTLVMLAAGIGIAPFRSVILSELARHPTRRIILLYSNRTVGDTVFGGCLNTLASQHPNIEVHHFVTREDRLPAGVTRGRMPAREVMRAAGDAPDPEFFICGSIPFVRDLWRGLRAEGVAEERLYTEAFFSH